jgi:GNAT superfamily N-acetyltransferase
MDERLRVRPANEADLDALAQLIDEFVRGHPAERHPRPLEKLRAALFGEHAVAHAVIATVRGRAVGMAQWWLVYDVFWAMHGVRAEWLYVRHDMRGIGIAAALIAEVCARGRDAGAEYLHGGGNDEVSRFYERIAVGSPTRECYLSAQAFQVVADLAGSPVREIVRRLPSREQNYARGDQRTT